MNPPKAQIAFRIPEGSIALLPGLYSYYWHLSQSNLFELDGAAGVPNPANSALYWLAKMLHAAEDVGLADPMALVLATAACQAGEVIGWPEARIPIAEAALYIATANKSTRWSKPSMRPWKIFDRDEPSPCRTTCATVTTPDRRS